MPRPDAATVNVVRCLESLENLLFLRPFVGTDEPKYDSESQGRACQGCNRAWRCLIEIENDESANQSEQRDQDNGPHLNDSAAMMPDYQQRVLEFKCDEYGEHHSEEALEHLRIGKVDQVASGKFECVQEQLPGCGGHDDSDHQREDRHDRLLELFIDRECLPFGAQVPHLGCEVEYFVRHQSSSML
jgi:hypothetical protein